MRWMKAVGACALMVTVAACSTSPTGRSQMLLLDEQQLSQMGAQAFDQYQQQLPMHLL